MIAAPPPSLGRLDSFIDPSNLAYAQIRWPMLLSFTEGSLGGLTPISMMSSNSPPGRFPTFIGDRIVSKIHSLTHSFTI